MPLARCAGCNGLVSRGASQCPHCGQSKTIQVSRHKLTAQAPVSPVSSLGLAGMICGITGVLFLILPCVWWFGIVPDIVAVVLSCIALGKIRRGEASGRGMAITGLVCGIIGVVISVPLLIILQYIIANAASE